ncbi:diguanylate cyclase (GGDEF)-like protein [Pararhizobium capsulatum DSM 1112]|uniref:Diguanylate cyclase (GGDEF)-like protein n=1 Tax=Pararhizobium capsulatum DSM 1112 TaxID=1121113 RepID=A0ABU0BS71_9HYPH|nr:EAL domain-containing protein [Pararhizobium capsulatum]MDQ0320511.1 diguanylate cyclase (GGDEF)-like protein [Pararhizobium capsulatum DSM 1112]
MFRRLRAFLAVDAENPELIRAQQTAFTRQIPLLYVMLMVNAVALAATHFHYAPLYLTVYSPLLLCIGCCIRIHGWWLSRRETADHNEAVKQLQSIVYVGMAIGIGFTVWSLSLFPYGDAYTKTHVAFFMAITVIGCIFCLMHLRTVALVITAVVLLPFTLFFLWTGHPVFIAIATNMAIVTIPLVYILLKHYDVFTELIESQKALLSKQAEMQALSDENQRLANIDSLTELPNRRNFRTEFVRRLQNASDQGRGLAVGIVDLDGFKPVNDAFGHSIGDKLLMEAARRLMAFSEYGVFAARLGGDEFGLLIEGGERDIDLRTLADRICYALHQPYYIKGITAKVSASLGLVSYPEGGDNAVQLFECADFALYHAKQNARGQAVIFSTEHAHQITRRSRIDQELKNADLEKELSVLFQPFVDSETLTIIGFEALARWDNIALGRVTPDIFIPAAERNGLMSHLTLILLEKALEAAKLWPDGTRLSFNLSARDIVSPSTVDSLLSIIAKSGFNPANLDFELTETSVMTSFDLASTNLTRLMNNGIGIALDDFGTGQSSLGYVHRLPLRKIKVDRSFITDIDTNGLSRNIIRTIVDLCRNIDCVCVIEGMETEEQVTILRTLGCAIMQGYYFGRPMTLDETLVRLQDQRKADGGNFAAAVA